MAGATQNNRTLAESIQHLFPCTEAAKWMRGYPDTKAGARKAWRECRRGDWMMWLLGKQVRSEPWSDDRKPLLACALDCAETVKHLWPEKQREQIVQAISVLRRWIEGGAEVGEARQARRDLSAAAYADADAAAYAAHAAAYAAADAAYAAAYAAHAAAYAAADAAYAAAAYATAAYATAAACADIVRRHYPCPPEIQGGA